MSIKYNIQKMMSYFSNKIEPKPKDICDCLDYAQKKEIKPKIKNNGLSLEEFNADITVGICAVGNFVLEFPDFNVVCSKKLYNGLDETEVQKKGQEKFNKYISKIEKKIKKITENN